MSFKYFIRCVLFCIFCSDLVCIYLLVTWIAKALSDGVNSPSTPSSSSGHKNSLKGTKLARRARSFKDDLFEKISQMRTPTNTLGRSHSPHSPRIKNVKPHIEETKNSQSLEIHVRHIKNALKHFKDVISKKKLEVLPGNGTVVLELIAGMYAAIQSHTLNENSSTLISATTQVYLALGKLIKLCDEVLLCEDENECPSLSNENVKEVVDLVENAVQNLVNIANEKIKEKDNAITFASSNISSSNTLNRPSVDVAAQRTSLPDIPLTPKERDILEKSISNPIRTSHSTESILRDSSPPPKPPLPNRLSNPPPLPPKKKNHMNQDNATNESEYNPDPSLLGYGVDHISMRSRSPDDNSSLLSASAGSLDSAFNHSREEDELKALVMDTSLEDQFLEEDVDRMFAQKTHLCKRSSDKSILMEGNTSRNPRHSNESGFASMQSIRASMQSVSTKRSSEQSIQSQKFSIASSSDSMNIRKFDLTNESMAEQSNSLNQQHKTVSTFSNQSFSSMEQNLVKSFNYTKVSGSENRSVISEESRDVSIQSEKSEKDARSFSSISKNSSLDFVTDEVFSAQTPESLPPALPAKTRQRSIHKERHVSTYDNVEETDNILSSIVKDEVPEMRQHSAFHLQSKHQSLIEPRRLNTTGGDQPPPLPVKKKHIIAYMEICSASTKTSSEQFRHSVHTYNMTHSSEQFSPNRNITHSQTMNLSPIRKQLPSQTSLSSSPISEKPPALPPKKQQRMNCKTPTIITTPPPSPKPTSLSSETYENRTRIIGSHNLPKEMTTVNEEVNETPEKEEQKEHISCNNKVKQESKTAPDNTNEDDEGIDVILRNNNFNQQDCSPSHSVKTENIPNLLEELDISDYLIFKKEGEEGPEVKGGYLDALIVHATKVQKNAENAFSEAFITTFRTFIPPLDLIEKLTHRYTIFCCQVNDQKQKAAKETFSLLVRVVNDLTASDLTNHLLTLLVEFVFQLVCSGQLSMAKLLRNKIVEKVLLYKEYKFQANNSMEQQRNIVTNQPTLLELKSGDIAEQMTLLDAELFQKIEIPEVLLFAKEQCEEKSPNLNKFTEHFNKMSYWARSQILKQDDAKDREKHVIKFIKIMKHLRKMNNYNSYLALLSALDSAPIRRLEWHKTITEGLKEYCALIDSSSSFRIYRQALADTNPPCIPYIGLVLQDLTFVHVGNPDYLKDSIINFSKRWQQHNIIVNMKRFKKCAYPFKKNEKVIRFFENFENFLGEEQMWQISENIKPRGRKPVHN